GDHDNGTEPGELVSDHEDVILDGESEAEIHPNDEDELVVNINASEASPVEGVNLDLNSSPVASDTTSSRIEPFPNIQINNTSEKSTRSQLRAQLNSIHTPEEKMYWWNMCHPPAPNVEREARRVLEPPAGRGIPLKRKREERIQHAMNRGDVEGGEKSQTSQLKKRFFGDMLSADISMYEALQYKYHCDGGDLPIFDARKFCDELRKDRRPPATSRRTRSAPPTDRALKEPKPIHWSPTRVANSLGYKLVPPSDLRELPGHSFSIWDVNQIPVMFSLANYFGPATVKEYTADLLELATQVKLATQQADANTRGANYVIKEGRDAGCINITHAWRSLGGKVGDLKPSAQGINGGHTGATKSATTFNSIQTHHQKSRKPNTLVNYAIYCLHRPSFWAYLQMSNAIRSRIPAAAAVATHDPAFSTGKSVIYSRNTPRHFDNKEAPEGWSPLVVMGTCKTGMLSIPRLGIKFPYLPGHLVLLRGRLLDHEVIEWDGEDSRICVAHFTHVDKWKFADIVPPL
ncbi:hypothetical protein FS749_010375, partial [Ceratobasidium sp. UAMH 11750]